MSSPPKSVSVSMADARTAGLYRVAIVGAGTLKGKEVAEVLSDRNFPSLDIKLLDDDESLGQLGSLGDEISFIQGLRAEQFEHIDFTFFASDPECTRKTWATARRAGSAIVDMSFALENEREARVRSPWIERQLGVTQAPELQPGPSVVGHPAAVVLALVLLRAQKVANVRRVIATVFEPASEHGQKGMDELHEQTVNLLSFQPLPKTVFDVQVAFNLLARYGENSQPSLASVEQRVLEHYRRMAGASAPALSLMMVQAPIFHGCVSAVYLETEKRLSIEELEGALRGEHVSIVQAAEGAPSNVNAAGQGDILISLKRDANQDNGIWLWVAADNLRIAATTAVECAESMAASRPRGKIQ